tara:strand:- start:357 stop:530 length:174 start_codon:yes stop_codon:yes gene_type:complete
MVDIFTKARVSNITAAVVIFAVIYGFVSGVATNPIEASGMGVLLGFASKHLFDSSQK